MNLRKIALEEWAKTQHDREERDSEDRERFRAYAARKLSDMLRVDAQEIIKNVNLDNQFLVGELLIQARRVASGEVDFRILLPCPDCGLNVWSRPFYGLSDLGEVIENSITDYTHVCRSEAVHKPSWMITSDEIDIAYNELLTPTVSHRKAQTEYQDHRKARKKTYLLKLASGEIVGKNENEREAAHRAFDPLLYADEETAREFAANAELTYEMAKIRVGRIRALLAFARLDILPEP